MHWDNFYRILDSPGLDQPSSFAQFCLSHIAAEDYQRTVIWDIGCGTGRDTAFFLRNNLQCVGVDSSLASLDYCRQRYPGIDARQADALNLPRPDVPLSVVYARFFLHAIDATRASSLLKWAFASLVNNGRFYIECRSTLDPMFGEGERLSEREYINGHYRRFVDLEEIVDELECNGFSIEYAVESPSLSPAPGDNPVLIRIIAKKTVASLLLPSPNITLIRMRSNILKTIGLLNECKVEHFAHCGSVLGALRCHGITPWDTDFDLGIFIDQIPYLQKALAGKGYFVSSASKNLCIDTTDIPDSFDLANELIWIHNFDSYIQLNVVRQIPEYDCEFWHDFAGEPFVIHVSNELRLGYQGGKYNIPSSLFFPLAVGSFYDQQIMVPSDSHGIVKRWYGSNCLTHYPPRYSLKEAGGSNDGRRFFTSDSRIDIMYRA